MTQIQPEKLLLGHDTYILAHQADQVYFSAYPYKKLSKWRVVYNVNPRERLYTPGEDEYQIGHLEHVDEVFQEEELTTSFHIDPAPALDSLVADVNDLTFSERRRRQPIRRGCRQNQRSQWRGCSRAWAFFRAVLRAAADVESYWALYMEMR
jgi:hypothetical protein